MTQHNFFSSVYVCSEGGPRESDGYFMRAHTITVLIFLIGCLVYVALFEPDEATGTDYNSKRGLLAALYFWLALGMTIMPDGPFSRPHPIIWRLMFSMSIVYELLLIFLLFQACFSHSLINFKIEKFL